MPTNPIDPISSSDRPSTVDETEIAGAGASTPAGQWGTGPGGGARALVDDIVDEPSQTVEMRTTAQQAIDEMSTVGNSASGWAEEQLQQNAMAARREEYERQLAECEAANAAGEAYYWGDEQHGDDVLSKVTLSDGTTVWVTPGSDPPEVVDIEWAADAEFLYQGDYLSGGESYQVIELPTGHQILVDEDGQSAGLLEDMPPDVLLYPDPRNGGELTEAYIVPAGPPTWDTLVYDAATDELIIQSNTGASDVRGVDLWVLAGDENIDPTQVYSTYIPPGADYVLVIDSAGNVVDSYVPLDELEWSILGIVEYYEDGEVRVDFGPLEVSVDVAGEDGGISITGDVLAFVAPLGEIVPAMEGVGDVSVGVSWEDGDVTAWGEVSGGDFGTLGVTYEVAGLADFVTDAMGGDVDFSTLDGFGAEYRVDTEFGIYGVDGVLGIGVNNEGNFFLDADATVEFQLGNMGVEIDANFYTEIGDTFEMTGGYRGQLDMFGFYLEKGEQFSLVIDDGLLTATYATFLGAGHEQFGGVRLGYEVQVETDGTKDGTSGAGGVYGAVVDKDGEELLRDGIYADTDINGQFGTFTDTQGLDTKVTKNTEVFADDEEMPLPSGLLDETPDEIVPDDVFDDAAGSARGGRPVDGLPGGPGVGRDRADDASVGDRAMGPHGGLGRGAGPAGGGGAGNETTIPGSIDPMSPIGAAGGGRPGAALSDGPTGPGAGHDRADGVFVQEVSSGVAEGRFGEQAPGNPGSPEVGGVSDRSGRLSPNRGEDTGRGFEPNMPERGEIDPRHGSGSGSVDDHRVEEPRFDGPIGTRPIDRRAADDGAPRSVVFEPNDEPAGPSGPRGSAGQERPFDGPIGTDRPDVGDGRVEGRLPGAGADRPGLRGQPDPEERSATGRPVREGVPPMGDNEGGGDDTDVGLPPEPPTQEPPGGGEGDEPPPDASPPTDAPPSVPVPFGVARGGADDITAPRPIGAISSDAGQLRPPAVDAASGGLGDRLDRAVGGGSPMRDTDDITGPQMGSRLPVDRPSAVDRPMDADRSMGAPSEQETSFDLEVTGGEIVASVVEVTVEAERVDDDPGLFGPDSNGDDDGALGGPRGSDGPGFGDQLDQPGT